MLIITDLLDGTPGVALVRPNTGSFPTSFLTNGSLALRLAVLVCAALIIAWRGGTGVKDAGLLAVRDKFLANLITFAINIRCALGGWFTVIARATHLLDSTIRCTLV